MKHLRVALLAIFLVAGLSNANAQDENNPWAISLGVNAVDFFPTNNADLKSAGEGGSWYDEFFNAKDHYNVIPSLSRISVAHYIDAGFSVELAGSLNRIEKIGERSVNDLTYIAGDLGIKYSPKAFILKDLDFFDPYVSIGGGYTWINSKGAGTVNGGIGANLWFGENFGVNVQTLYKHAFDDANVLQHWQHAAGIVFKFGGTDTDGDGIYDKDDACPDVFGLEEFNGCPDSDGDGIIDSEDACPDAAGPAENNGCPDSDGDGVIDSEDACPNEAGPAENKGCPWGDADGDGVLDNEDKCVNEAGPAENGGCPWADTDGDGVADKDDNCPDVAGPADNDGCPVLPEAVKAALASYAKTIVFDTGKATIKDQSAGVLNDIVGIMDEYPNAKFNIKGYTDSTGGDELNQKLSEGRAEAVLNYLTSNGVDGSRLNSSGYGKSNPIATNDTAAGRRENRRVEISLNK